MVRRLASAVMDWGGGDGPTLPSAWSMDGTPMTPDRYTGRLGIPGFAPVAKVAVIRTAVARSERAESDPSLGRHASIDERHAEEFFRVVEPRWSEADGRYLIDQGLQLGAYVFDRLYRDLWRAVRGLVWWR